MNKRIILFFKQGWVFHLLLMGFIYQMGLVWQSIPLQPRSLHISAQCDRASIAQNYYVDQVPFFEPHINNLLRETGIAATEFPLIPYLSAQCYKFFGYDDSWYRFIVFLFFTSGFIFLFFMVQTLIKNTLVALLTCAFWLCSPTLLFYIPNFNPDPASLGLMLIGWFIFFSLQQSFSVVKVITLTIVCALAVLLKASSAISVIAMLCVLILDWLKWLAKGKKSIVSQKGILAGALLFSMLLAYGWYHYAANLNARYYSGFFTLTTRIPENLDQAMEILDVIKNMLLFHYYPPVTLYLLAAAHLLILLLNNYINRQLLWISFILAAGSIAFFVLMFGAMKHHDYYIIALLPWPLFVFTSLAQGIYNWGRQKHRLVQYGFALLAATCIFLNTLHCQERNTWIYDKENYLYNQPLFEAYYTAEPALRQAGVKRNDRVVSFSDFSYDVALYLLNQKGFSVAEKKDVARICHFLLSRNAKYLLVNYDDCLPESPLLHRFLGKPLMVYQNLKLYKPHLEDPVADTIKSIMRKHLAPFWNNLKADPKFEQFNQGYVNITGVPMEAVYEETSIYQYRLREEALKPLFDQFVQEQKTRSPELTHYQLAEEFIRTIPLNSGDAEVIKFPVAVWFD